MPSAVDDVLTVPTSAITTAGSRSTVTVLDGETTSLVTVTSGAVGVDRTEIVSGLTAGQLVVLADLNEAIPTATASTSARSGSGLGGSGLGGSGGGAAGGGPAGGGGAPPGN